MIEILHFDKDVIVCIKPFGILSQGDSSGAPNMPDILKKQTNSYYVEVVHRLDRPVTGVMVFPRNKRAAGKLTEDMKNGKFQKEYLAVVKGRPEKDEGMYKDFLYKDAKNCKSYTVKTLRKGAKEAVLEYKVLGSAVIDNTECSLVKIKLHTGRTHQIRVQFSSRGMPLLGDGKYGSQIDCPIALMSHIIGFTHPKCKKEMTFTCPMLKTFPWNKFMGIKLSDNEEKADL